MKKIFIVFAFLLSAFNAFADGLSANDVTLTNEETAESFDDMIAFCYGTGNYGNLNGVGVSAKATYHAAMWIDGAGVLGGYKIKGFSIPYQDKTNMTGMQIWIASADDIYTKLYTQDVDNDQITNGAYSDIALDEAFTIPSEGIYVGYDFTVTKATTNPDKYPVMFDKSCMDPGTLLLGWDDEPFADYSDQFGALGLQIYVSDFDTSLDINLDNSSADIVGLQFNLTLPEGITPVMDGNKVVITATDRLKGSYSLRGSKVSDGSYLFTFLSNDRTPIEGNTGKLFSLSLQNSSATDGSYTAIIKNVITTDLGGNEQSLPDASFAITAIHKYKLTYYVDGEEYKSLEYAVGAAITPEAEPTKEGYTFSGWSEIPATMPAHDVEVTGSFTINKYTIKFVNEDGTVLQSSEVEYGATPVYTGATPTKASNAQYSYTFAGWTPEIVAVTGDATYTATYTSSVNKYTIKFVNEDGTVLQSSEVEYGVTPVYVGATPTKVATVEFSYTFAGWTPEVVAVIGDATYTATYTSTPNSYKLTYKVDGDVYKEYTLSYGDVITPEAEPTKEGYTFSGWSEIPETMPAHDVEVNGSFEVNYYKVSYFVGNELVHQDEVAFGETFELWIYEPEDGDLTFNGWIGDIYDTMPAHDISYVADITSGIAYIINNPESVQGIYTLDGKKVEKMHQGVNIIRNADGTVRKVFKKK